MTAPAPGPFPCREPGCTIEPYALRKSRNAHEDSIHLHSAARVFRCPRNCGPLGNKYDIDGLVGHMRRSHLMTDVDIDAAWPQVEAKRRELTGEADAPEPAPEPPPAEDVTPPADVVAKQVRALLEDYDQRGEALREAEARISELSERNERLEATVRRLRELLSGVQRLALEADTAGGSAETVGEPG